MKHYRIAAYITAYEDPEAVKACITAIQQQACPVEKILVVDNSLARPVEFGDDSTILIEYHPENLGISGALNIAMGHSRSFGLLSR